jgi:hypothetical protein
VVDESGVGEASHARRRAAHFLGGVDEITCGAGVVDEAAHGARATVASATVEFNGRLTTLQCADCARRSQSRRRWRTGQ